MATPEISLDPMTAEEYTAWLAPTVRRYAQDRVESGDWSEQEAPQRSEEEFRALLPQGVRSVRHYLFTVREAAGGESVGVLWLALKPRAGALDAFVYNVEIDERFRGRGYGRATMLAGARRARDLGAATMSLHVFGGNTTARALYSSLGFVETNVNMTLPLGDAP